MRCPARLRPGGIDADLAGFLITGRASDSDKNCPKPGYYRLFFFRSLWWGFMRRSRRGQAAGTRGQESEIGGRRSDRPFPLRHNHWSRVDQKALQRFSRLLPRPGGGQTCTRNFPRVGNWPISADFVVKRAIRSRGGVVQRARLRILIKPYGIRV